MQKVGIFLDDVLQQQHPMDDNACSEALRELSQPLYPCSTYSQMQLLCLVLKIIFTEIPNTRNVLRCRTTTMEEELCLFLTRAKKKHSKYLVLNVNKLPFKLQEVGILVPVFNFPCLSLVFIRF